MGLWYKIIKERGENDRPNFGKYDLETGLVDWLTFSHADMDGVGAMLDFYEKINLPLKNYPYLKEKKVPNFFERLKIFYRMFFCIKKVKTVWKENNFGLEPENHRLIYFNIFSAEETLSIENYCKLNQFSVNAFLMNISSKVLLKELSINTEGSWTLPVNLRPLLKRENLKSNHSSGILVNIQKDDTPQITHNNIRTSLKNKEHWGIWWIHQIGKYIGYNAMRFISNQNAKKYFIIGSFSNLSTWDLPPGHIWVGGAPGSKNFPLSVMLMKANERLSLSLKIHPFVLKDLDRTKDILDNLVRAIRHEVDNNS